MYICTFITIPFYKLVSWESAPLVLSLSLQSCKVSICGPPLLYSTAQCTRCRSRTIAQSFSPQNLLQVVSGRIVYRWTWALVSAVSPQSFIEASLEMAAMFFATFSAFAFALPPTFEDIQLCPPKFCKQNMRRNRRLNLGWAVRIHVCVLNVPNVMPMSPADDL